MTNHAVSHQRSKNKMLSDMCLIWLDNNIDENSNDYRTITTQLHDVMNDISTFTDVHQCIRFVENLTDGKAYIIVSGSLGQDIVPRIHSLCQVDSIFIFCNNKKYHEQWIKKWSKIKGAFTNITSMCDVLKQIAQQCERNSISMSFIPVSGKISKKNLDELEPLYMYTQIMKEILLTIEFEEKHFQEFIKHCDEELVNDKEQRKKLRKLEKKYGERTPIWWYTYESFLYRMVNKALREMDADLIVKLGFFIKDVHQHIERLHKEQFGDHKSTKTFRLYRGQGVPQEQYKKMANTEGGLLAFNCFLSTSKNREVALGFAQDAMTDPDLVGILFVMEIDPTESTTPFASIGDVSYFKGEEEILFSMHAVFRILKIKSIDENQRIFQVNLKLTSDNDKDLCVLTDYIQQEIYPDQVGWARLGLVLLKIGKPEKAAELYQTLLEQASEDKEKAAIYNQLGRTKSEVGQYAEAIVFYEKSIELEEKLIPRNHRNLANSYNNIGAMYLKMDDRSKALSSYKKALTLREQLLPSNHPDLAASYNDIGNMLGQMNEHAKALPYFEKSHEIRKRSLPSNHPDLASSYGNIGVTYMNLREHLNALHFLEEKTLAIQEKTLPPNHPNLGITYNNIGWVYENMQEYSKARTFYERALKIGKESLPKNHPTLKQRQSNLDRVKQKLSKSS